MEFMGRRSVGLGFVFVVLVLVCGFSSVEASIPPARIVSGFVSNAVPRVMKWLWSLKATTKTVDGVFGFAVIASRPLMKFEGGYTVETVFDGSKLGIEPYSIEVLPNGELLILDSANSNLYRISSSLSLYSRPKLVAGSAEGYSGHVDGKHREARLNHPKGIAVDDRGNIYVADTMNMVIRKISDAGVTTIAGGKWSSGGGHVDGPSDEAKFSSDFDVVYIGSSCSLLVNDRGNRAIREIQLHFDDCAYQYESGFPLGIAVLLAAGFFGYMLALLQRRVCSIVSSHTLSDMTTAETIIQPSPYQKPAKSVRPPLIPTEEDMEKQEEGLFRSLGKLFANAGTCAAEILGSIVPGSKKGRATYKYQDQARQRYPRAHSGPWQPQQESFEIPKEEEPPSIETRTPTPRKTYAFMTKDAEKMQHQLRQTRAFYTGWDDEFQHQQQHQPQQQQQHQKHQHRHQHHSSSPKTYYEQNSENTNEIVFGAVQEQEGRSEAVDIKPAEYADFSYDNHNFRYRSGYAWGY
ncbi:hypothetical protein AKJ16_DCAP16770 [Drosera capensis]